MRSQVKSSAGQERPRFETSVSQKSTVDWSVVDQMNLTTNRSPQLELEIGTRALHSLGKHLAKSVFDFLQERGRGPVAGCRRDADAGDGCRKWSVCRVWSSARSTASEASETEPLFLSWRSRNTAWRTNGGMKFIQTTTATAHNIAALPLHFRAQRQIS
jgi:hypothetical protein